MCYRYLERAQQQKDYEQCDKLERESTIIFDNYYRSVSDSVTVHYSMLVEYSTELNSLQLAMHLPKR